MTLLLAYRRLIARILLIIFSMMMVNGIVFRHAHKLPSGRVIIHAHPYWPINKSPYQPNTHTTQELFWLDTVSNLVFEGPAVAIFVFAALLLIQSARFVAYKRTLLSYSFYHFSHRGPPAISN
ncbi:hypothetical protein [Tellurirhabdus bombi]|uniref:hypothetical protein n=1 Tax=Tellurirhabdus bombi TaxID=2907205 RepID=UPI001F4648B0|nr:hypothetical protein [Tellurirhabdus bombi]